ncbi:hypothetical protein [Haploplasma axanthum]|uniref:Uncharacterized protein n=1 Tax=Haploplasma axanthum TaxID=29552 RepID=A0A449BBP8_HAPAX|nr:hypothetical protein [Haploplasma axanthum]VEU79873.1 Uncharacterised protein [Haploplasma axanthum]
MNLLLNKNIKVTFNDSVIIGKLVKCEDNCIIIETNEGITQASLQQIKKIEELNL